MGKRTEIKRGEKIFFNCGAVGPISGRTHRDTKNFLEKYFKIGPPEIFEEFDSTAKKLSSQIAELLNCEESEISITKNTTEGIIIASESLPLNRGDEVLLMEREYPANLLAWLKKRKDGLDVKIIPGKNNQEAFENLLESISQKTKAVSISWEQYYDGFVCDMELLSGICRKNNIFLVVDAVHVAGSRRIDLKEIHIDILTSGGQKQIGALPGSGFIYINKNTLLKLRDFKVGIRSVKNFSAEGYELKDGAERFQDGTPNIIGIISLHSAISQIKQIGIGNIEAKNSRLLEAYKEILDKNNIAFINYKNQGNIISLIVPDPEGLAGFLRERKIYIKAIGNIARVSFSHASNVKDFAVLAKHVKKWISASHPSLQK